jgi:hypothetical protein
MSHTVPFFPMNLISLPINQLDGLAPFSFQKWPRWSGEFLPEAQVPNVHGIAEGEA